MQQKILKKKVVAKIKKGGAVVQAATHIKKTTSDVNLH